MQITIDTKADHPDHIRQAIMLLQNILGSSQTSFTPIAPLVPQSQPAQAEPSLFSIFDSQNQQESAPAAQPQIMPAAPEPEQTEPKIELY